MAENILKGEVMAELGSPREEELTGVDASTDSENGTGNLIEQVANVDGEEEVGTNAAVVDKLHGVSRKDWSRLADNFKPGLAQARRNLRGSGQAKADSKFYTPDKIALCVEGLVTAVEAAKNGIKPQSSTDILMTPEGALQELYNTCRKSGMSVEESTRLITVLTVQPGLLLEVLNMSSDLLESDRNTHSGGGSKIDQSAYSKREGELPPSQASKGFGLTQKTETGKRDD